MAMRSHHEIWGPPNRQARRAPLQLNVLWTAAEGIRDGLALRAPDNRSDSDRWYFMGPTGPVHDWVTGALHASSSMMVHRAASADSGIAWLLEPHVLDDIRANRLCRLLPHWASEQEQTFISHPSRRNPPSHTRALIDFFVSMGREAEAQIAPTHVLAGDGVRPLRAA